jgi:hypothetical protein
MNKMFEHRDQLCRINKLLHNMRSVKGKVKNSYRPHKLLYYTILDAICLVMLLDHFKLSDLEENIPFPVDFQDISDQQKINWLNNICGIIIFTW